MERYIMSNKDNLLRRIDNITIPQSDCKTQDLYPFFFATFKYSNYSNIDFISSSIASLGFNYYELVKNEIDLRLFFTDESFDFLLSTIEYSRKNNLMNFNCIIKIKNADGVCFDACANGEVSYENDTEINLMVVVITDDNDEHSNMYRISSLLKSRNYAYLQNQQNDPEGVNYKFISTSLNCGDQLPEEFTKRKKNILKYIVKEDYEYVLKCINEWDFNISHNMSFVYKISSTEKDNIWIMSQNYINTQGENEISDSFILNISDHEQKNYQLKEQHLVLEKNLERSHLISDVLKFFQISNDYYESLKNVMVKLCNYIKVSYVKIFFPTANQGIYTQFKYTRKTENFSRKTVDLYTNRHRYSNIVKSLSNQGVAYSDNFRSSFNCESDFSNNYKFAHFIYTVKIENYQDGYISLSDVDPNRKWDNDTIAVINDVAQVITGMLSRFYAGNELSTTLETFKTVLDNIDSYVCVSTLGDNEIIFSNEKFNNNFNIDPRGKQIWECLGLDIDDYNYLLKKNYNPKSNKRSYFYEIYSPSTKQWLDFTQTNIIWVDGQIVTLSTFNNITQKIEYEKLIEVQALNDHLTGLPNRRMLEKDFAKLVDIAIAEDSFGYMLFLDLDNFKNVNDGLGHHYGDALLENISTYLKQLKYIGNYAYRFGGDEFVLLLSPKYKEQIDDIVKQLHTRFQQKWDVLDTSYFCTMSMGVAKFPYNGTTLFELLKKVDMAMYNAKNQGKNRVLFYKTKIGSDLIRDIELQRYLRESIANQFDGFSVFYQPLINAKTKKIEGAEALLRWKCENLGNISPVDFIPLAENIGLIIPIGEYVMNEACKQCRKMVEMGNIDFKISINLSVNQILESDFVEKTKRIIKNNNIKYSNVTLEITESIAINDFNLVRNIMNQLSVLGISISLDDFGTGYSALNNIKELPLNIIKIDKSFVDDLNNNTTSVFVKLIIALSHELNIKVCAEGVETECQFNTLRDLNTDIIQGYFFGKPIPSDEFEKLF